MSTPPLKKSDAFILWSFNFEKESHPKNHLLKPTDEKYLKAYTLLNIAGYFLSPIAGIARLITVFTQGILFYKQEFKDKESDKQQIDGKKQFLKMQAARGVMEFFCMGPILGFVDAKFTYDSRTLSHDKI